MEKMLPRTDEQKDETYQEPVIKAPQTIVCPNKKCRSIVGKLTTNLYQGTKLKSSMFEGPMIRRGGDTTCHKCGSSWFLPNPGTLSTINGWFPPVA